MKALTLSALLLCLALVVATPASASCTEPPLPDDALTCNLSQGPLVQRASACAGAVVIAAGSYVGDVGAWASDCI